MNFARSLQRVIGFSLSLMLTSQAWSQTSAIWQSAASGTWTDPFNWSTNPVYPSNDQPNPGDSYDAVIAASGADYTVSLSAPVTLNSLLINSFNATLSHSDGTLTLNNASTISLGTYQWTGGTLMGSGPLTLAPGTTFDLSSQVAPRTLSTTVNNSSVVMIGPGSTLFDGGTLNNGAGGVIVIGGGTLGAILDVATFGAVNRLTNAGTIVSASTGFSTINLSLSNSGTITSNFGTLILGTNGGTQQTFNYDAGTRFTGNGTIHFSNGQQVFNGTATLSAAHFRLNSGPIVGAGDINVTSGSTFHWTTGTIAGATSAALNIQSGAVLDFQNGAPRILARVLNNSGTANFDFSTLTITTGLFNNTATGVLNLNTTTGGFLPGAGIGSIALTNFGTINVNNAGTATNTVTLSVGMLNGGTINVPAGTLNFGTASVVDSVGATLKGSGTVDLGSTSGLTHTLNGPLTLLGNNVRISNFMTLTGDGALNVGAGGSLTWGGGSISGGAVGSLATMNVLQGGQLGLGTSAGASRNLSRTLNNSGTVTIAAGSIGLFNGAFNNLATGVVNVSSTGFVTDTSGTNSFSNAGTIVFTPGSTGTSPTTATLLFSTALTPRWTNSGTILCNFGSLIFGNGHFAQNVGAYIGGTSTIDLASAATQTVNGTLTLGGSNMQFGSFSTGTFDGSGNIDLSGTLNWNNGSFLGTGLLNITPTGVLNVGTNGFTHVSFRNISNSGTINLNGGTISLGPGASLTNQTGGVINLASFQPFELNSPRLVNFGTVSSNFPANTVNLSIPLLNSGTFVSLGTGSLSFTSFGTLNAGSWFTGPSTIQFNGIGSYVVAGTTTLAGQNMVLRNGFFAGTGTLNLTGNMTWIGGSFSVSQGTLATLNIASGATLNVTSGGFHSMARAMNNSGVINIATFTNLTAGSPGVLTNLPTGQINLNFGSISVFAGAPSSFANQGLITGSGISTFSGSMTNTGTILVNNSSTFTFSNGTVTHNLPGATFTGGGTVDFSSGGDATHVLNGSLAVNVDNALFDGSTITGSGDLNIAKTFYWSGGSFTGTGAVNILPGATLNLPTASFRRLSRPLFNQGVVNFSSSSLALGDATFTNTATGVMYLSATPNFTELGGTNLVANAGTIIVPVGSITISVPFSNTGTVIVGAIAGGGLGKSIGPTLNISGPVTQLSGSVLTGGSWIVGFGSELDFPSAGSITMNLAHISLQGALASLPQLASLNDNEGELSLRFGRSFTTAGSLANSGVINIDPGGALIVHGTLINSGSINGTVISDLPVDLTGPAAFVDTITGAADVSVAPAAHATASHFAVHALNVGAGATLQIPAGSGTNSVESLSIAHNPPDSAGGKLDLTDTSLIVDYTGASPLPTIRSLIASASAGGSWSGDGITSSLADAMVHALGYTDDGSRVLIEYTFYGDANCDGRVDATDLGALALGWQSAGDWHVGDFNYDGAVDVNDLSLLALNWQAGIGSPSGPSLADALASLGLPGASVPEPTWLIATSLWTAFAVRRPRTTSCPRGARNMLSLPPA